MLALSNEDVVRHAMSRGAIVFLKKFDHSASSETICIHLEPSTADCGLQVFALGLFVSREESGWVVGFSTPGHTRPISDEELISILNAWLRDPRNCHLFDAYLVEAAPTRP